MGDFDSRFLDPSKLFRQVIHEPSDGYKDAHEPNAEGSVDGSVGLVLHFWQWADAKIIGVVRQVGDDIVVFP